MDQIHSPGYNTRKKVFVFYLPEQPRPGPTWIFCAAPAEILLASDHRVSFFVQVTEKKSFQDVLNNCVNKFYTTLLYILFRIS